MTRLSTRMMFVLALAVVPWALVPPTAAGQQLEFRGFEGYVGYGQWVGDEVSTMDPGFQVGVMALGETAPHFGIGGEVVFGWYEQLGFDVSEFGVNGLARYALGPRDGVHGYVQGRVGWSRLAGNSLEQSGLVLGPELGLEVPTSGRRVVVAVGGTWRSYENVNVAFGFPVAGTSAAGYQLTARVGFAVGEIF